MNLTATVLHAFKRRWLLAFGPRHPAPPRQVTPAFGDEALRVVLNAEWTEADEAMRRDANDAFRRAMGGEL